jgi:hypothetical protein
MNSKEDSATRPKTNGWNWQVKAQTISNAKTGLKLSFESTGHQALPFSLTIETPEGLSETFIFDGIGRFDHSESNPDVEPMRGWLSGRA